MKFNDAIALMRMGFEMTFSAGNYGDRDQLVNRLRSYFKTVSLKSIAAE